LAKTRAKFFNAVRRPGSVIRLMARCSAKLAGWRLITACPSADLAPLTNQPKGTPSATAQSKRRDADIRSTPFSYFWTCWKANPSSLASSPLRRAEHQTLLAQPASDVAVQFARAYPAIVGYLFLDADEAANKNLPLYTTTSLENLQRMRATAQVDTTYFRTQTRVNPRFFPLSVQINRTAVCPYSD
jgi:hypothetical protein